jgi:hypothetical protein
MRLHLYLSHNGRPIPFDYQHYLTGAFHKWLEANDLHDRLSLYSLSWLYEGRARKEAIEFPRGAHWFLSVHDEARSATQKSATGCASCVLSVAY